MATPSEIYDTYSVIEDFAERERVAKLDALMREIQDAPRKMEAYRRIFEREAIPEKTLQRFFKKWKDAETAAPGTGALALADKRKMSKPTPGSMFYRDFKTYAERDLNTDQGGYDQMLRDLHAGAVFSFGNWRDLWRLQFPGEPVPDVCPINFIPKGFTYNNMNRLHNADPTRKMAIAWNRGGQFAASAYSLPVIRSRVGLPVGSVFQADDVWHNIDVFAPGQQGTFQPMEYAIYDVASAFKVVSAMKPRILTVDPKTGKEVRDNLKEIQFRFAVQYLLGVKGFHKDGCTLVGERGTTALRDPVLRRIASVPIYGKLFRFSKSGILNEAAHKGLLMGNAGGNPRMKSLCECAHNVIHNATASILGSRGRDAAHMHESNGAVVKYTSEMLTLARKIDPMLVPMLQLPILNFDHYCKYFYMMEDAVMDRTAHNLEGWADREIVEYRLSVTSDVWLPIDRLNDMSPAEMAATLAVINSDKKNLFRNRKMSRREVWQQGQRDLIRWPLMDLPAFADLRDAKEVTVGANGTIAFTDKVYYPSTKQTYLAQYTDRKGVPHRIAPGKKVTFYWNPLGELANQIWIVERETVTDENGQQQILENILGTAPLLKTAAWADEHSIKVAMGQKLQQVAEVMSDTRARHVGDAVQTLAAQKINRFLIDAAKKVGQQAVPPGETVSAAEVLGDAPDALPAPPVEDAAQPAIDVLEYA